MMLLRALASSLLISCTVNKYYVAPPPPQPAPAEVIAQPQPAIAQPEPAPPADPSEARQAELERRFGVAKAFLLANKSRYTIDGSYANRTGHAGEQAPIFEAPGGGFLLVVNRTESQLVTYPVLLRLDASGNVVWSLDLPRPKKFDTYEVGGGVLAPDGTLVVEVTPYLNMGRIPVASIIAKVAMNGTLVWSMQLSAGGDVNGPYPQRMVVEADGTIALFGHATYKREQAKAPGTGDYARTWKGAVSASGRQLASTIGALRFEDRSEIYEPPYRPVEPYWCGVERCY
jgi:hypothetical protein